MNGAKKLACVVVVCAVAMTAWAADSALAAAMRKDVRVSGAETQSQRKQ